ncbi:MAG: 50S ribosomal protein L29 [Nitrososphaerota archaeon]|nr:50S ribosomal protein L29 [Nitrososphaerota archaeon]
MPQLRPRELRNQDADKLRQMLFDLRSELSKLAGGAQRGIVKKDVGNIRRLRKDIARVITVLQEKGVRE